MVAPDDDGGAGSNARIVYTATASGTYYLQAGSFADFGTGSYRVFAHQDEYRDTVEGNGAAGAINAGGPAPRRSRSRATTTSGATLISGLTYTLQQRGSSTAGGTLADPLLESRTRPARHWLPTTTAAPGATRSSSTRQPRPGRII